MTKEEKLLQEICTIAKKAMIKKEFTQHGSLHQITVKQKVKFYGMAQDKN